MYMIELKVLMPEGCTEEWDTTCDYLMDLADLPCAAMFQISVLSSQQVEETFPHYEEEEGQ